MQRREFLAGMLAGTALLRLQFAQAQESYRTLSKERSREVWDFAITIPWEQEGAGDE